MRLHITTALARRLGVLALSAVGLSSAVPVCAEDSLEAHTMERDIAVRSGDIHWPEGFTPMKADLFAHNEIIIHAACEKVWSKIINLRQWPDWYPNGKDVAPADGTKLISGQSKWHWKTFGTEVESSVHEFVANERLGWFGNVPGKAPEFYHTWLLKPNANNCLVVTEEVGVGADPARFRQTNESLLHRGHDLWLVNLKWISEL